MQDCRIFIMSSPIKWNGDGGMCKSRNLTRCFSLQHIHMSARSPYRNNKINIFILLLYNLLDAVKVHSVNKTFQQQEEKRNRKKKTCEVKVKTLNGLTFSLSRSFYLYNTWYILHTPHSYSFLYH